MDSSRDTKLTPLQRDLLQAFFEREQRFYLTGGAALAGFYFGHRTTEDLDLFAPPGADLADGALAMSDAALACGGVAKPMKTYAEFRRLLVRRGEETCLVDLVIERAPMLDADKPTRGGVRIDTIREIAANKLCTLIGRSEIKDLVDLRELMAHGIDLEVALADAEAKDGGADPATMAWLLSQLEIAPGAALPGGVDPVELAEFRQGLVGRLQELALRRAGG